MRTLAILSILFSATALADDLQVEISAHCESEFPDDFQLQAYCVEGQTKGVVLMANFARRYDIEDVINGETEEIRRQIEQGNVPLIIMYKCWSQWEGDYQMIGYCMSIQEEAAKELGKL